MSVAVRNTLSLLQPWAELITRGAKRIESRGWSTAYRGPLAIHASLRVTPDALQLSMSQPFQEVLNGKLPGAMPRGVIVAVVNLVDIWRCGTQPVPSWMPQKRDDREWLFGDYAAGRYAWRLENICALATPVAARGALNIWKMPRPIAAEVARQVSAVGTDFWRSKVEGL